MGTIRIDVWLYGDLTRFAAEGRGDGYANFQMRVPKGTTVAGLLTQLHMDSGERGFTFINGTLSAMPGIQKDLSHELKDQDRIAFFHLKSMWPFQYRQGVSVTASFGQAMHERKDDVLRHSYEK